MTGYLYQEGLLSKGSEQRQGAYLSVLQLCSMIAWAR